VLLNKEADRTL